LDLLAPTGDILVNLDNRESNFVALGTCRSNLVNLVNQGPNFSLLVTTPAGHILVDLLKHNPNFVPPGTPAGHILVNHGPNFVPPWHQLATFWFTLLHMIQVLSPLAPAVSILVNLVNHDSIFVSPGTSWLHFG
jgi:hypothetical protein